MEIIFSLAKESSSAEKISSPGMSCKNWVQTEKVKYTAYRNTFLIALLQSQPAQSPQKSPRELKSEQLSGHQEEMPEWASLRKKSSLKYETASGFNSDFITGPL